MTKQMENEKLMPSRGAADKRSRIRASYGSIGAWYGSISASYGSLAGLGWRVQGPDLSKEGQIGTTRFIRERQADRRSHLSTSLRQD